MKKVICFWGGLPKIVEVSDDLYSEMLLMREEKCVPSVLSEMVGGNYTVNAWQDYDPTAVVTFGYNQTKSIKMDSEFFFRIWKKANIFFKQEGLPIREELADLVGEHIFEIHTPDWWDLCWNPDHRRGQHMPKASVRSSGTKYITGVSPRKYGRKYTPSHSVAKRFSMV